MAVGGATKELVINTLLAFAAGAVTTFGTFIAATPKNPGTAALLAAAGGAAYAGFRFAVGFLSARFGTGLSVDK
jgi:hypothetical protein